MSVSARKTICKSTYLLSARWPATAAAAAARQNGPARQQLQAREVRLTESKDGSREAYHPLAVAAAGLDTKRSVAEMRRESGEERSATERAAACAAAACAAAACAAAACAAAACAATAAWLQKYDLRRLAHALARLRSSVSSFDSLDFLRHAIKIPLKEMTRFSGCARVS